MIKRSSPCPWLHNVFDPLLDIASIAVSTLRPLSARRNEFAESLNRGRAGDMLSQQGTRFVRRCDLLFSGSHLMILPLQTLARCACCVTLLRPRVAWCPGTWIAFLLCLSPLLCSAQETESLDVIAPQSSESEDLGTKDATGTDAEIQTAAAGDDAEAEPENTLGQLVTPDISDPSGAWIINAASTTGVRIYQPNRWSVVSVTAGNLGDEPTVVHTSAFVRDSPELRYGRDLWIPPRAIRESWVPVFMPELRSASPVSSGVDNGGDTPPEDPSGNTPPQRRRRGPDNPVPREIVGRVETSSGVSGEGTSFLAPSDHFGAMAYIEDFHPIELRPNEKFLPYEAILAARNSQGLDRTLRLINERLLPASPEGWDPVRHAVLVGDRLDHDTAAQSALRQWIAGGGHLWIQLNTVRSETVQQLLGSAYKIEEIDRVQLTNFELHTGRESTSDPPTRRELEQPAELIRVLYEDANLLYRIDEWPAALSIDYGQGQVFITLLSPGGWIRPRGPNDPPYDEPLMYTDFMATPPLEDLASQFMMPPVTEPISIDSQATYVTDRIGYEIPARKYVLQVLFVFCASIGGVGLILWQLRRLEYLAPVSLLAGFVAAFFLVRAGVMSRGGIPPTISSQQFVYVMPETAEFAAEGTVAIYQPDRAESALRTDVGTRINPDLPQLAGNLREIVWSSSSTWDWGRTVLPPGVQLISTRNGGELDHPLRTIAHFTDQGISGALLGLNENPEQVPPLDATDGLLVFPNALPMSANINESGEFASSVDDVLARAQFFNSPLLTDEQRRRKEIFQSWYEHYRSLAKAKPLLVFWSEQLAKQLNWAGEMRHTGAALVAVPLELQPPEAATSVIIPSPLLQARTLISDSGQSTVFRNQTGTWNYPNSQSTSTRLRFQLPELLLPLELDRVHLTIDCNLPSRTLDVFAVDQDRRTPVLSRTNASGQFELTLDSDDGIALDEAGGIIIDFEISDLTREVEEATMANSAWSIFSTTLDVEGTTASNHESE